MVERGSKKTPRRRVNPPGTGTDDDDAVGSADVPTIHAPTPPLPAPPIPPIPPVTPQVPGRRRRKRGDTR